MVNEELGGVMEVLEGEAKSREEWLRGVDSESLSIYADILRKAAGDVAQGLWCTGTWFKGNDGMMFVEVDTVFSKDFHEGLQELFGTRQKLDEQVANMERCAEGSIYWSAYLGGHSKQDGAHAIAAVEIFLETHPTTMPIPDFQGHEEGDMDWCPGHYNVRIEDMYHPDGGFTLEVSPIELVHVNDIHLAAANKFTAGEWLAEAFNATADWIISDLL